MIKVIAFDFGGILGPDADDWNGAFAKIKTLTGLSASELQEIFNRHWPKLKLGKEPMLVFWQEVAAVSLNKVKPLTLRRTYNQSIFADQAFLKFVQIVQTLKNKYRVVLLANDSDDDYLVKTRRLKLDKVFDKLYCSSQLGMAKPDRRIFEYLLRDQKIKPNELLLIDNQLNNIEAAKSLGINSILFRNYAQAVALIQKSSQ